jgi:hypothetical protein
MNCHEVNLTHVKTLFHLPIVLCMVNCFKLKWVSVSKFCVNIVLKQPGPCWLNITNQTHLWAYIWISYKTSTLVTLLKDVNVNTILLSHNFMGLGTNLSNIPHTMLWGWTPQCVSADRLYISIWDWFPSSQYCLLIMVTRDSLHKRMKLAIQPHQELRLRVCGILPPLPIHAFMAWCLGNITFKLTISTSLLMRTKGIPFSIVVKHIQFCNRPINKLMFTERGHKIKFLFWYFRTEHLTYKHSQDGLLCLSHVSAP